MYLENVFSAGDIQKQLPNEYMQFYNIDKFWCDTMFNVYKKARIVDNIQSETLHAQFKEANS